MEPYRRATPDTRASGQHKVVTATAWTGLAAVAVTGWLAVGLSPHTTVAAGTTTPTSTDDGTSSSRSTAGTGTGSGSVSGSGSAPLMTSGGS